MSDFLTHTSLNLAFVILRYSEGSCVYSYRADPSEYLRMTDPTLY